MTPIPRDTPTMSNPFVRGWRWLRQWFTTAEKLPDLGRNAPCWCGSREKYKHCHMAADRRRGTLTRNVTPNIQKQMMERAAKRIEKARAAKKR